MRMWGHTSAPEACTCSHTAAGRCPGPSCSWTRAGDRAVQPGALPPLPLQLMLGQGPDWEGPVSWPSVLPRFTLCSVRLLLRGENGMNVAPPLHLRGLPCAGRVVPRRSKPCGGSPDHPVQGAQLPGGHHLPMRQVCRVGADQMAGRWPDPAGGECVRSVCERAEPDICGSSSRPPPFFRSPYSHILQGKTQTPASPACEPRMCVGAQPPRASCVALLFLGLVLGSTAQQNCAGDTYPNGNKCCHECQPGEWPGHGIGKGYLRGHGTRRYGDMGMGTGSWGRGVGIAGQVDSLTGGDLEPGLSS